MAVDALIPDVGGGPAVEGSPTGCEDEDEEAEVAAGGCASLEAVGVAPEELASCVSVLQRLHQAKDTVNWQAPGLREFRKAIALHTGVFGQLPQKDAIDAKQRAKDEKNRKRERRQRQVEADRRWKDNAELRASRLARLEALERDSAAAIEGAPVPMLQDGDAEVAHGAAVRPDAEGEADLRSEAPPLVARRVPDGPAIAGDGAAGAEGGDYARQQACYTCKARFSERHHFYSHLCPVCAALNFRKRIQVCDLSGRVCLVTGARVKIGFQTALKLLRMGARVIATTRFPQDAGRRFAAEADAEEWSGRLQIRGVDFRFLGAVERLCSDIIAQEAWLDVIVNNACQTIRRPAGYYRHLVDAERMGALRHDGAPLPIAGDVVVSPGDAIATIGAAEDASSAALSQLTVVAEDAMSAEETAVALPLGEFDAHGQQLDTRSTNSWLLKLGEVSTPETVEVFCINALTPFVLNGRLRPLLERSPHRDRYIINVSAMEGKFYRYKQPTHPHTNMAKAALNMLTRTSAEEFAKASGIYMNSVDTGWINDENPLPTAQRIAADHGFQTPIDEVDAAARILDPVVSGVLLAAAAKTTDGGAPQPVSRPRRQGGGGGGGGGGASGGGGAEEGPAWGRFFKDYVSTEW